MQLNRRDFLKRMGIVASSAFAAKFAQANDAVTTSKPNFVFFLVDDLGWTDLGCYGSTFYETPKIDKLAQEAMRFTDAYAACPVCSPTRASIMTGKYPTRVGITDWIPGYSGKKAQLLTPEDIHQLPLEEETFPEVLKQAGYSTFFAGKWHLGSEGYFPEQQGFDINKGGHHRGSPPGGYFSPYKNPKLSDGPKGEYLTDRLADESVKFLQSQSKKQNPFLLYLSFYTVHTPIQAKQDYVAKYKTKLTKTDNAQTPDFIPERQSRAKQIQDRPDYAGMVQSLDEAVGRVQDTLAQRNLADNTIIILMSDNGGLSTLPGRRNAPTANVPLRAGKGWVYEGGIRVPMIIKWPGVTKPDTKCNVPVISTDFYPTILEMAGLPLNPKQHVDGLSLVPLLQGGRSLPRKAIFWHYPHYHGSGSRPSAAVRAGDYKLLEFFAENQFELYNLKTDLAEKHNLAAKLPQKVAELKSLLRTLQKTTNAKFPRPNPEYKS
jgi:arylsulfatase A-like enzyme